MYRARGIGLGWLTFISACGGRSDLQSGSTGFIVGANSTEGTRISATGSGGIGSGEIRSGESPSDSAFGPPSGGTQLVSIGLGGTATTKASTSSTLGGMHLGGASWGPNAGSLATAPAAAGRIGVAGTFGAGNGGVLASGYAGASTTVLPDVPRRWLYATTASTYSSDTRPAQLIGIGFDGSVIVEPLAAIQRAELDIVPSLSPDGKHVAYFTFQTDGRTALCVAHLEHGIEYDCWGPWVPTIIEWASNRMILFVKDQASFAVDVESRTTINLSSPDHGPAHTALSPDTRWLALLLDGKGYSSQDRTAVALRHIADDGSIENESLHEDFPSGSMFSMKWEQSSPMLVVEQGDRSLDYYDVSNDKPLLRRNVKYSVGTVSPSGRYAANGSEWCDLYDMTCVKTTLNFDSCVWASGDRIVTWLKDQRCLGMSRAPNYDPTCWRSIQDATSFSLFRGFSPATHVFGQYLDGSGQSILVVFNVESGESQSTPTGEALVGLKTKRLVASWRWEGKDIPLDAWLEDGRALRRASSPMIRIDLRDALSNVANGDEIILSEQSRWMPDTSGVIVKAEDDYYWISILSDRALPATRIPLPPAANYVFVMPQAR